MYSVPEEATELFLKQYCICVANHETLFVAEAVPPLFRMFMDLDLKNPEGWKSSDDVFQQFLMIVQAQVRECYPNVNLELIVTSGPWKAEVDHTVKSCFHLYWTYLWVDQMSALQLRYLIVQTLSERFPRPSPSNSWKEAVDHAVYCGSGLRMFGSMKAQKCPGCKGRGGDNCPQATKCLDGWVKDAARPYKLDYVYSENLYVDMEQTQRFQNADNADELYEFMKLVTIRAFPGTRMCEATFPATLGNVPAVKLLKP